MTTRRSFLERLGLGVGAGLLSPIANALVSEAQGQVPRRKRFVVFIAGNGIVPYVFTPPEFAAPDDRAPVLDGPKAYTWPDFLKPLAAYRNRMLLLDGFSNQVRGEGSHSATYSALSCMPMGPGATANNESPGGITVDQFIAARIGASTARQSVLVGVGWQSALYQKVFASDYAKPEQFFEDPARLHDDLFGLGSAGLATGAAKRHALFDSLRWDIKRLQGAFAGPERAKLDSYLAQIDDFERRQAAVAALGCSPPTLPAMGTTLAIEDRLSLLFDIATTALVCGMTNVVGVSNCTGNTHSFFPTWSKICAGTGIAPFNGGIGHSPPSVQGPAMALFHAYNAGLIARMANALAAIPEGNGTALDNTVIVWLSDNGDAHHSSHDRWPIIVLGNAGGALKSDGRFIRYGKRGTPSFRSLADFHCTIATAAGAPTDSFGKGGGSDPVKGTLSEIVA